MGFLDPLDPFGSKDTDLEFDLELLHGPEMLKPGDSIRLRMDRVTFGDVVLRPDKPIHVVFHITGTK